MGNEEMLGRARLSRRGMLGLGAAAGLAGAALPVEQAFARWSAGLSKSELQGTISFCQWLYESVPAYNVVPEKQPAILYKKYMQMHPGVQLQMVQQTSGDWNAWFLTRAIANRLPDLLGFPLSGWSYITRGFFTPITKYLNEPNPYIAGNKRWIDSLPPHFLRPFTGLDGQIYALSADTSAQWIYYNPEHLDRINMKPPATWAELLEACAKLKAKGIIPYSQQGKGPGWPVSWWFQFAESSLWASEFPAGTTLDVASWIKAVKQGMLKKTDARTREAWQLIKQFSQYWRPGTIEGDAKAYQEFADGKFTFAYDGSWNIGLLQSLIKGRFPVSALPTGIPPITKATSSYANGSLQAGGVGAILGDQLWITKHAADHIDVVIDFLRYFSSPQVMGPMALEIGQVPMVAGVSHLPPLVAQAKQVSLQPGLLLIVYEGADAQYTLLYDKMCQGYLAGAISLDSALSQLEQAQQAAVARLSAHMSS